MASYWSKRRRVLTCVKKHIDSLNSEECSNLPTQSVTDSVDNMGQSLSEESPHSSQSLYDGYFSAIDTSPEHISYESLPYRDSTGLPLDSDEQFSEFSDDQLTEEEDENNLKDLLVTWVGKFNICHSALGELLSILRKYHPYLPKDSRTLLQTAKSYDICQIAGGSFHYFGTEKWVKSIVGNLGVSLENVEVSIQVNIDGLPLFKSSGAQLWPILGRLLKPVVSKPFVIGLFFGDQKPTSVYEYLDQFVYELQFLFENGVLISEEGQLRAPFTLSCVICDAPARAFVKQIKGHNAYHGCDKCTQRGVWNRKVTFPETRAAVRTDVSFDNMEDEDHHNGPSPFVNLPIGMVSQFPIDPMHLVYLGVVKRIIWLWMKGPVVNGCRLGGNTINAMSKSLVHLKKYLPREFNRKSRSLEYVERWKATEFRQFLLYTGPVILKKHLSSSMYKHFMLLFVAIFCLSSTVFYRNYGNYAHELLCKFVQQFAEIYGSDMLVFNVHGLVHLSQDVQNFGPLDGFSAFIFESFLGNIKRLVRKPSLPLQQVIRRISESRGTLFDPSVQFNPNDEGICKRKHVFGPLPTVSNVAVTAQYKEIHFSGIFLSTSVGNNCILLNDVVALVRNIITISGSPFKHIVYDQFTYVSDFFRLPLPSSDLRIKQVSNLRGTLQLCTFSDIICKCVLLPYEDKFVCIPLIHSFDQLQR